MIRSIIAALLWLAVAGAPAAAQSSEDRPSLRAAATVTGEIVRIGDLVDNAGAVADVPIFRAPDLGQTGSVPLASVLEALRGHHLLGLDTHGVAEVAVTRAARMITGHEVEARILRALAGRNGVADSATLAVVLDNEVRPLTVEATATAELSVVRLSFEPRTNRFDVTFELPGSLAARRLPLRFTGLLTETFEMVVAAHDIAQGAVLQPEDIAIERRPKPNLTPTTVTALEQAQGLATRHALRAGQIIRQTDIAKPELVGRNDTVTIVFQVPGITLTIVGKATEPGAMGDVINVTNVQTKHVIAATVIGPDRVAVTTANARLAANATPNVMPNAVP